VALAATGLVYLGCADQNDWIVKSGGLAVNKALGAAGFFATDNTYSVELVNVLGAGHEVGHGAEGDTAEVSVKASTDDAEAPVGQLITYLDDVGIEELDFVYGHDSGQGIERGRNVGGAADRPGIKVEAVVGSHPSGVITGVNGRLKDLDMLAGDNCPAKAANQLFCLAAKHAAANQLDSPPRVNRHLRCLLAPSGFRRESECERRRKQ
jgi:hypothetical protein